MTHSAHFDEKSAKISRVSHEIIAVSYKQYFISIPRYNSAKLAPWKPILGAGPFLIYDPKP